MWNVDRAEFSEHLMTGRSGNKQNRHFDRQTTDKTDTVYPRATHIACSQSTVGQVLKCFIIPPNLKIEQNK